MAVKYLNLKTKSKLSVILLFMACFVCNQASSSLVPIKVCDSKKSKVVDNAIGSNCLGLDCHDGVVSTVFKERLININAETIFVQNELNHKLIKSLSARGPPLA